MTTVESGINLLCECGHSQMRHDHADMEDDNMCGARDCLCDEFQPRSATRPPAVLPPAPPSGGGFRSVPPAPPRPTVVEPTGPTAEQLIAAGKRSDAKRVVALAEKITALLTDLQGRLREDRAAAEARARRERVQTEARREVAELEAKLAAARAKLRGDRTPPAVTRSAPVTAAAGSYACPDCDKSSPTPQGLSAHRRFNHGPKAG